MMCAWNELISILPIWLRSEVDMLGKDTLNELRLRINAPPELVMGTKRIWLTRDITLEDLNFVINTASRYSPWRAATISEGYITAPGGHRIGIGGEYLYKNGTIDGVRQITSLCIRIARDFPGIGNVADSTAGNTLILGAPGYGKTTLLRDMVRHYAELETVCVVDERSELFPEGLLQGKRTDILTGCPKTLGVEIALRTLGPERIAVDEITAQKDCLALINASNCGVRLTATAHGSSVRDFRSRKVYEPLIDNCVFDTLIILRRDRSYEVERLTL